MATRKKKFTTDSAGVCMHKAAGAFRDSAKAHAAESRAAIRAARESAHSSKAMTRQADDMEQAAMKIIDLDTLIRLYAGRIKRLFHDVQAIKKHLGME